MDNNITTYRLPSRLLALLLLFTLGIGTAWGQDTDYSGVYYIASRDYAVAQTTTNYYLCPTENWYYYQSSSPNFTDTNNGMPFMTTYQCRNNVYDATKAIWIIEKKSGTDYYYIKHATDGKYLTYNNQISNGNAGRMRVHLESSPIDDDDVLFQINYVSANSCYEIITKKFDSNTTRKYLNVTGASGQSGNINQLVGTNARTDGPDGCKNVGGIIGLYTAGANDSNGRWYLENALSIDAPTITNNNDGTFTIAAATGATIYYTTDGTTPTTESYTGTGTTSVNVSQEESMRVIKAIAKAATDPFPTFVTTYELIACAKPVISVSGGTVTITCATEGATIHYTTNGSPATSASPVYNAPFAKGDISTIRAIATRNGYAQSNEATLLPPTEVSSSSQITDMSGSYILTEGFTSSASIGTSDAPFTGTIDGNMVTLSGLSHPLVAYANDATIKNVMLKDVHISGSGNVGAIAGEASGYTRIYNCGILPSNNKYENESSYVSSSNGYCGGLVGWLKDDSRVINCFSYANITGGTTVAGIVGYNDYASKMNDVRTMVVNCMFYGEITGNTIKPVYGGKVLSNKEATGINNYNYFRGSAEFNTETNFSNSDAYFCSWPATEEYLTRFEYYRSILNSNRQLCTWWVNGTSGTVPTDEDVANVGIAKWVLDPSIAPYPILKKWGKYPSVINQDKEYTYNPKTKEKVSRASAPAYQGKKLGTLSVTVKAGSGHQGSGSTSEYLNCIVLDMDTLNYDYGYAKIQLPYYNEVFGNPEAADHATRYAGNYTDKAVTGWKVTSVSGGTSGTFKKAWEDGYNFADRNCTSKDLYDTSGRVFAQGGYYYVPEGVTSITIEAYWANKVVYLHNYEHSLDRVNVASGGTTAGNGTSFSPAGTLPTTFQGQTVYTTLQNAIDQLTKDASLTVYDQAIVLVGNVQVKNLNASVGHTGSAANNRPFTIMSIDQDIDNEPDYCLEFQFRSDTTRPTIHPVRFDFLPIPELGLAIKTDSKAYAIGVMVPLGHFEITETAFMHTTQFEYDGVNRNAEGPMILNGGQFEQIVIRYGTKDHTNYFLMGGHFRMGRFTPGYHATPDDNGTVRHCAVNAIGGDFPEFYLSGIYNPDKPVNADNPHCYINGGRFGTIAGAGYEQVDGNVTFQIDHAVIDEFYGGGMNSAKPVTGSIDVTINNSIVHDKYCGGPMVGEMTKTEGVRKTVTTNATNTIFGQYFGGGNGGTSYYREQAYDTDTSWPSDWKSSNFKFNTFNPLNTASISKKYDAAKGYHDMFEYEVFNQSNGVNDNVVARSFIRHAQFGTTITGNVTNNLTGCTINRNFYGGGNLGTVDGDVTSTLDNTVIGGSAFGAGYSAAIPQFRRHDRDKVHIPARNKSGQIVEQGYLEYYQDGGKDVYYRWTNDNNNGTATTDAPTYYSEADGEWKCYTPISLEGLGAVSGKVTLKIKGTTTVAESVYGGGEESGVGGDTEVNVTGGTIGTTGKGGATWGNIFGGGKGKEDDVAAGQVKGNTNISISGSPYIIHNVYGGGAYGSVGTFTYNPTTGFPTNCTENTGVANITITGGTFGTNGKENGMIFGSSRGLEGDPETNGYIDKMAWVNETNVVIGTTSAESNATPAIKGSVYGGGENGHNLTNAHVTVHSGTIGITDKNTDGGARYPYRGNVYGGGCGTDTYTRTEGEGDDAVTFTYYDFNAGIVLGNTLIDIDGGHIVHNVYGGGAMGSVGTFTLADAAYNTANPEATQPIGMPVSCAENTGTCTINITGGKIGITDATMKGHGNDGPDDCGHVFGAGRGTSADPEKYPNVEYCAFFNNTQLNISGKALICGSVYGGSESGHVLNNTNVTMSGGQVGCGLGKSRAYTDDEFNSSSLLDGTAHWDYTEGGAGAPYDQYADSNGKYPDGSSAEGGKPIGTDGRTFFGNVFAGGSGYYPYAPGKWLKSAGHIKGTASVTVSGGHILNNLYGGCEMADIEGAVTVTMTGGTVGVPRSNEAITQNPNYGNVYGAGMGDKRIFFNTSTNVASTTVNISNGTVYGSVYGGGEDGHVMGSAVTTISQPAEKTTVIGCDGQSGYDGNVFGAGQGHYGALTSGVVGGNATLNVQGGTINGSVYGGGRIASVGTHFAMATIEDPDNPGQQIPNPEYGQMTDGDDHGCLTVNLTGGTIMQNVYGGCMGTTEGLDYGVSKNVSVELNNGVDDAAKGCIVLGPIFGCNNVNSSPEGTSTVHIYKTQRNGASRITNTGEVTNAKVNGTKDSNGEYVLSSFDVPAVYGGGNLAAYTPKDENGTTDVIIDGCSRTSIGQVYGGGNAASTPATSVTINGTFEIGELFGGGNGKDKLPSGADNPGANVGYKDYHDVEDQFPTKEDRVDGDAFAAYRYGTGLANVTVKGGTIHRVFGGSNTKGNVRKTALTMLEEVSDAGVALCDFHVDEAYGGGKSAPMDAEAKLLMACIPGLEEVYGGAQAADIKDNVTLTITNGTFDRVFGGNNLSGTISGAITVNIEEVGCRPIIIGELYGGGNLAAYSIYGYNDDDTPKTSGTSPSRDPEVNVKSFTSIGSVFGGGYGEGALMVGSPTVNINEVADPASEAQNKSYKVPDPDDPDDPEKATTSYFSDYAGETKTIAGHEVILPSHVKGKMGSIHSVFGGGNAAKVQGNTTVNIGTTVGDDIYMEVPVAADTDLTGGGYYTRSGDTYTPASGTASGTTAYYKKYTVLGVDIRNNVYGGGNNAEVTGKTNVNIGKAAE